MWDNQEGSLEEASYFSGPKRSFRSLLMEKGWGRHSRQCPQNRT